MRPGPLPVSINFVEYLDNGASLQGFIPLSRFARFRNLLASEEGEIDVRLHFEEVGSGLAVVVGAASVSVELFCQNCLDIMALQVVIDVNTRLVKSDSELHSLAANIDGIVVDTPRLSLTELLEDDLILVLPMVPRHDVPCTETLKVADSETRRPFEDLSKLLLKREKE